MSDHKVRESNGCTVIDVAPAYTREVFLELLDVARGVVERGRPRLILNMDELLQITSEGIGLLVLVHDECMRANGRMALAKVSSRVERVLRLAGVEKFFSIFPDEPAAVEALRAAVPDAPAAPAAGPAEVEAEERADPGAALRRIVSEIVKSRRHQQVIEFFVKRGPRLASLDETAQTTRVPRPAAEEIVQDLCAAGLVRREGGLFVWGPSPEAQEKIDLFRNALADPGLRSRVLAWILAEEKKA